MPSDSTGGPKSRSARLRDALGLAAGDTPFPWQERLLEAFVNGEIPAALDIPTGLGKTAVMAAWLVARACGAPVPRRLVYVVDRRAVVDQATSVAEQLRTWVTQDGDAKADLGLTGMLPVSTLRGQHVDNRAWLEDPAAPAIVLGTVDMIGSRLLFGGYGVSRKMRPYHAGLLGADTLIVLDEAHLVPPFERLIEQIASGTDAHGQPLRPADAALKGCVPPLRVLSLSATGRLRAAGEVFGLNDADDKHPVVKRRLSAGKRLTLHELRGEKLEDCLAERAWALAKEREDGENTAEKLKPVRIIVYCDSREAAEKVSAKLKEKTKKTAAESRTELFVGARRVKERDDAERRLKELGFLAGSSEQAAPAFLVATAAGEVGVDLDADHMVGDIVAWERMVQRVGRVNRRGGDGRQAEIVVLLELEPEPKKAAKTALGKQAKGDELTDNERKAIDGHAKLLATRRSQKAPFGGALQKQEDGSFDVSPGALRQLGERARQDEALAKLIADASSPTPLRPALNRALVDAWSMTSLPEHTGRPEVAPWIRGWVDELPQTTVVWRKYLPVRKQPAAGKKDIEDFFEAAPIHVSETLETEAFRVFGWLQARGSALEPDDVVGVLLGVDGDLIQVLRWRDVPPAKGASDNDKKRFQSLLSSKTLVVSAAIGGLRDGLLNAAAVDAPVTADGNEEWMPRPKDDNKPVIRFRVLECHEEVESADDDWREGLRFDLEPNADGSSTRWLSIQKWRNTSNTENDRAEGRPQALAEHQDWTAERAKTIGDLLALPQEYIAMLAAAARLHDEGKRARNWQRAFRAERDAKKFRIDGPLAKTRGPINQSVLGGYRHEFGSLPYAKADEELKKLLQELQDLALHLIAAHHGFARPLIDIEGCEDAPPTLLEERAREVALRYARLQKRWGPWGLAWWEALLRAADAQASRDNDRRDEGN